MNQSTFRTESWDQLVNTGNEVSKYYWQKIRETNLVKEELKNRLTKTIGEIAKMPNIFDKEKLVLYLTKGN